ncbi:MAG: EAL domain-containing protein [Dokdonella sp.]|jgi:diguanylate cyclase (GGDEF)-like protein|nr:EAL domain-containing protein [Dokdonella sp.]
MNDKAGRTSLGSSRFEVAGASGRPLEILLVEDNPGDVRLVAEALRQARLLTHLRVADSGDSALAQLRGAGAAQRPLPDLILLDLNLPGLSGHELLHTLKSDPRLVRIPVVVLTGSDADEDIRRAYDAHANCYVRKPVEFDQLLGVLQTVGNFWLSVVSLPEGVSTGRMDTPSLLLVEDNPGDARMVREMLGESIADSLRIDVVTRLREAIDAVREHRYTAILLDPGLPDSQGLETVAALHRVAPLTPLVVLSGHGDEEIALRAIQLGAQDYVIKSELQGAALLRTLRYAIERKLVQERLDYLASHDGVTGLPNRQVFLANLSQVVSGCQRTGGDAAVISVGLSGIGLVNQIHGHEIGDQVVAAAVLRIREALPEGVLLACTGSAEYSTILTDRGAIMDTPRIAEDLLVRIRTPCQVADQKFYLAANVGMSMYSIDADEAAPLLKCAETALYQAKNTSPGTFQFYSAQMNATARRRLMLERDLRHALEREEFELYYQPVVDAATQALVGAEALLRWRHPERGLLAPDQFLDVAEQSGLIVPIGAWAMATACRVVAYWNTLVAQPLRVSVNVSAHQLGGDELIGVIDRALRENQLSPAALMVELTENIMHSEASRHLLLALRERGISVALDDFGIGFSSLAYLRRFPVDVLKIDRSFMTHVPADKRDAAIVRAIVVMARTLGLLVIAEGVETEAQRDFLREENCDQMQGYLLARPMDAAAFATRLVTADESGRTAGAR